MKTTDPDLLRKSDGPGGPGLPAQRPAPATPPPSSEGQSKTGGTLNVFSHGVLVIWAFLVAMPLLWAVMTSFKDDKSIFDSPWSLPDRLHFENWSRAWTQAHMSEYFLTTVIVVACSLVGTLLLGSMAAYVLARFDFPGNRFLYFLFIGGLSFPVILALVPLFFVMNNLGLLNTTHGLILVYIAYSLPFTVFFLTAFFRTLPTSVAEAALIDGASHSRTFFQVMLPMAKPGLISVGIFNFLGQWNQYLLPTVLNTDPDRKVLSQGLVQLAVSQGYKGDWSGLFAGLVMAMLPVLGAYIVFQRQVVAGLTAGALK
ncbi:carbohydrate ABC transporter permease [Streptomyces albidoflavus]|jgi:N-acetylglucosamine transport system permease protein|uniref:Carbohydrate ABC transporter permease n=2 Tax=Streptomyces TaxID=1883 RepID=D6AWE2_9ACTN|nr:MULTISPECIES: carbohydrate ABC transporter permease [Streptomyces]MYQ71990.1 ABC transporter permease subunit [Streptomyces sp. SID4934]MYW60310.1 ABC transporter permease subunit [Streptomyces sp. SID8370]MYW88940.1 ABC transporter permease subunit [Streptomyces sp. SID8371]MYX54037.1 ABC transporter permease subunit [Streptomyces sp. SID8385]MYX85341.1 ABC transporter permease subunit [Streptomyces sp. SID4915]NUW10446.1 carbohydrate ABC transporter permease [Streptomyces sp. CAI-21]NVI